MFTTIALAVGVLGGILLQGLRKIEAKPPHKGQGTFLGRRIRRRVHNEGWGFYLGYPFLIGFIAVKVERIILEFFSEKTRTPDRAESRIPVFMTLVPCSDPGNLPGNLLIEYIDSGEEEGVKLQLIGQVRERIREWAMDPEGGPADWVELNQSRLEGASVLAKKIAATELNRVARIPDFAQSVPTWIWLRFYTRPRPTYFLTNERPWTVDDWRPVRSVLAKIEISHGPAGVAELERAVKDRRQVLEDLRAGQGQVVLRDLGCILQRLNLGDIDVLGEVGRQAEQEAKEHQERLGEGLELDFVQERMERLMRPPFNCTMGEARDIVQTERSKVGRQIDDKRISLDSTTLEATRVIFGRKDGNS